LTRRVTTYAGTVDAAFDQIRQAGSAKPAILIHMLEAVSAVAEHTKTDEQRSALARHAALVREAGMRDVSQLEDREDLERAFKGAMRVLCRPDGG
jgi:uncharacterized membrane protein